MIKRKNGVKAITTMVIVMIMLIISALPVAANEVVTEELKTTTIDTNEEQIDTKEKTIETEINKDNPLVIIFGIIALISLVIVVIAAFADKSYLLMLFGGIAFTFGCLSLICLFA